MPAHQTPEFDHDIAIEFLHLLDPVNDPLTRSECWFQLPERKDERGLYARNTHASLADMATRLPELGEMGYAVMVCINECEPRSEMKRKAWNGELYEADVRYVSQIKRVRAVWADFDDPSKPLPEFAIEPSFKVQSSPGKWHVYWLVDPDDPLPVEEFDDVQRSIIAAYRLNAADKSMLSPNHVMRLPGSLHRKEEPRLVKLVDVTGNRYGAKVLRTAFRPVLRVVGDDRPDPGYAEKLKSVLHHIHTTFGPPRPDGAYNVVCPWSDQHTSKESASSATYWLPSENNKFWGGFRCMHDHCAERGVGAFHDAMRAQVGAAMTRSMKRGAW